MTIFISKNIKWKFKTFSQVVRTKLCILNNAYELLV